MVIFALGILMYLQFVLVQTVYNFLILAKMWGSIKDGGTPITVGKAIGFLFIPIFGVYWEGSKLLLFSGLSKSG